MRSGAVGVTGVPVRSVAVAVAHDDGFELVMVQIDVACKYT